MAIKPRVKVPSKASAGDIVTIKTLISHPMETGLRKDDQGETIPRRIINQFVATFNGEEVFRVDLDPAVSANPYLEFHSRVPESGTFHFAWTDDDGSVYELEEKIEVG